MAVSISGGEAKHSNNRDSNEKDETKRTIAKVD